MLKTQRKVIFRMPAARTSMYVCLFVIFFRSRELALRKNAPIRSPGLLILVPVGPVVLKIYAILGNFFVHDYFCKKAPTGMFLCGKHLF
jgi:hypothetical protein